MASYGKRPLWQWILIYVVIGGIIYALVYYFVIAKRGGYTPVVPSATSSTVSPISVPTTTNAPATTSAPVNPPTYRLPGY